MQLPARYCGILGRQLLYADFSECVKVVYFTSPFVSCAIAFWAQRIAIARALVTHAPLILADEPTESLDVQTESGIMTLFQEMRNNGHSIVLVTHDEKIARQCDRGFLLLDGKLEPLEEAE